MTTDIYVYGFMYIKILFFYAKVNKKARIPIVAIAMDTSTRLDELITLGPA
jgi:hypothetical protein